MRAKAGSQPPRFDSKPTPLRRTSMNDLRTTDLLSIDPFEDAFRNFMVAWVARTNGNGNARSPQIEIDLSEANGNYKIKANIPGVSKDDIDVKVDDNNFC
jgi:HSP20 family protein